MSNIDKAVSGLTTKARKLSRNFHELLNKSKVLLADSQNIDQKVIDSCGVQDDQLLKNLVKYCNDDECIHQLLENAELRQTLEEYKVGIEHIMEKYKLHCQGNILNEHYNLRAKYVAGLQGVVNTLEKRIEEMTLIMLFTVGLEEQSSNENQRIIQQLTKENEMLRRKLQISNKLDGKDCFEQNKPAQVNSSTQVDSEDELPWDLDSQSDSSSNSCDSYVTCFSYNCESEATESKSEQSNIKKEK